MKRQLGQAGISLVELTVALGVTGLIMSVLATSFFMLSVTPAVQSDRLNALDDLRNAARWLTRDGQVAGSFTAGANPEYGSYTWTDYTGSLPVTRSVTYAYSGTYLIRHEYERGVLGHSQVVARNIADYGDVRFQYIEPSFVQDQSTGLWSLDGGIVTATVTSTTSFTGDLTDQVVSTSVASQLRGQLERAVNPPGPTPTPVPVAGEVVYGCGSLRLILGQYVSGGCAQLSVDDTSYYVLGASQGGQTKYTTFEITSTVVTHTFVSAVNVTYVGRSSNTGVLQLLYFYNPADPAKTDGGYHPTIADQAFTYSSSNTDVGANIPLAQIDVDYINSLPTKTIKFKAVTSHTVNHDLSVDQFVFRVQ